MAQGGSSRRKILPDRCVPGTGLLRVAGRAPAAWLSATRREIHPRECWPLRRDRRAYRNAALFEEVVRLRRSAGGSLGRPLSPLREIRTHGRRTMVARVERQTAQPSVLLVFLS